MTTPHERTKAVVDTREFLLTLASADDVTIRGLVQTIAMCLLRHYPLDVDLEVSASVLPGIWDAPKQRRVGSTSVPRCQRGASGRRDADDNRIQGEDDDDTACGS